MTQIEKLKIKVGQKALLNYSGLQVEGQCSFKNGANMTVHFKIINPFTKQPETQSFIYSDIIKFL